MSIQTAMSALAKDVREGFSSLDDAEKASEFTIRSVLGAVVSSYAWQVDSKRNSINEAISAVKDLLDPQLTADEQAATSRGVDVQEVRERKLDRKIQWQEILESQLALLEPKLKEAKTSYRKVTGETWKPFAKKGASPARRNMEELRKRYGVAAK